MQSSISILSKNAAVKSSDPPSLAQCATANTSALNKVSDASNDLINLTKPVTSTPVSIRDIPAEPTVSAAPESIHEDPTSYLDSVPHPAAVPAVEATVAPEQSTNLSVSRWADYDDDDDDWVPEILSPKPADSQNVLIPTIIEIDTGVSAEQGLAADIAQDPTPLGEIRKDDYKMDASPSHEYNEADYGESPDNGTGYDELVDSHIYQENLIPYFYEQHIYPRELIQDPNFEGYWLDRATNQVHFYCQQPIALSIHPDGQSSRWKDNYYWARHPLTAPISSYELLTMEFNSIAPASARRGGPLAANATWKIQRVRESAGLRALRIPAAESQEPLPVEESATPAETANFATPTIDEIANSGTRKDPDTEVTLAGSEEVDIIVTLPDVEGSSQWVETQHDHEVKLPDVQSTHYEALGSLRGSFPETSPLTPTPLPLQPKTESPSPHPQGPTSVTPLEFLISRGLYKDRNRVGRPPPLVPSTAGPVRSRLQDFRSSWASKLRSPVRSLTKAYRKVEDKIARKFTALLGAC